MAPRPLAIEELMLPKAPAVITLDPSGVSSKALTSRSATGAQPVSAPFEALNAASRLRALPFAVEKIPPTYTVVAVAVIALTEASKFGANVVMSAPVAVLYAAM